MAGTGCAQTGGSLCSGHRKFSTAAGLGLWKRHRPNCLWFVLVSAQGVGVQIATPLKTFLGEQQYRVSAGQGLRARQALNKVADS